MAAMKNILLSILIAMLLLSAIAVIYSKYQSRLLFIEIQKKEWGRLQLELTTLTEENRIEIEARNRLMLTLPAQNKIVYIKP